MTVLAGTHRVHEASSARLASRRHPHQMTPCGRRRLGMQRPEGSHRAHTPDASGKENSTPLHVKAVKCKRHSDV